MAVNSQVQQGQALERIADALEYFVEAHKAEMAGRIRVDPYVGPSTPVGPEPPAPEPVAPAQPEPQKTEGAGSGEE